MKINNLAVFSILSICLLFSACDNEIDLVAPYKETGVLYGLINPSDSIHIVRIQKAYLGAGNALLMAQVADSTYYPDILNVQLQRIKNGTVLSSFPLTRFTGNDKEEGIFPTSPNILYKSGIQTIFRDSEYRIVISNTETGHEFSAQTAIVDSVRILRPNVSEKILWANTNPVLVEYIPSKNGRVYNLTVRFHFNEEVLSAGTITPRAIDWVFQNEVVTNPENISSIRKEINGEDFYKFVGQKLVGSPDIRRYAGSMEFVFTAGAEFLANYVAINQSTTSVLTTPPSYSNVVGGTGIFSSRFITRRFNQMDPSSISLLATSPYTDDLGFQ